MKRLTLLKYQLFFVVFFLLVLPAVSGEGEQAITQKNYLSTTVGVYGNGGLEVKEAYTHNWQIPLGGTGFITKGNSIQIKPYLNLSPVSVNSGFDLVLTPIAPLQFTLGGSGGSGWYLQPFRANGVGVLEDGSNNYSQVTFSNFRLKGKIAGMLQFDLGYVVPGDWNHLVVSSYNEFFYHYMTGTSASDFWEYEGSKGKINSWNFRSNNYLGYSFPAIPLLNSAGFVLDTQTMLTRRDESTIENGGWGSNKWGSTISFMFQLGFGEYHSLSTVIAFLANSINYVESDVSNISQDLRHVDSSDPYSWDFSKVSVRYQLKF